MAKVDSRRPLQRIDVKSTPQPVLLPSAMIAGGRHRPTPEVVVASALDYCHKLDRELRQLGLRKEDRRLFVRSLVVNPHDPDAARLDAEASRRSEGGASEAESSRSSGGDAEGGAEGGAEDGAVKVADTGAILRAALNAETARVRQLEEQLARSAEEAELMQAGRQYEEQRADAAEAVQRELQDRLRRHRLASDGRAKHAADTVSTMKRMAEMEEQTKNVQRGQLLAELEAAHQHVRRAEQAMAKCEQGKARMAESFAAMERELKEVRRVALGERMQHEAAMQSMHNAKTEAEAEAEACRMRATASEEELETVKSRLRQQRGMNDLSRKSGTRMRADVQVSRADADSYHLVCFALSVATVHRRISSSAWIWRARLRGTSGSEESWRSR